MLVLGRPLHTVLLVVYPLEPVWIDRGIPGHVRPPAFHRTKADRARVGVGHAQHVRGEHALAVLSREPDFIRQRARAGEGDAEVAHAQRSALLVQLGHAYDRFVGANWGAGVGETRCAAVHRWAGRLVGLVVHPRGAKDCGRTHDE
jgi:hypothetical protein